MISNVTDAVVEEVRDWQGRPLERVYPILYLDALRVNVKESGMVVKKAVYVVIGVNLMGRKEVLGLWIEQTEGAKFWLSIPTELKNRGVADGLKGFAEAIEAVFPKTVVQIVRRPRHSECVGLHFL